MPDVEKVISELFKFREEMRTCNSTTYVSAAKVLMRMDLIDKAIALLKGQAPRLVTAEGLWIYWPDDENRPRWKCSRCGKIVHKDPADKLYCAACGQRNRKEA